MEAVYPAPGRERQESGRALVSAKVSEKVIMPLPGHGAPEGAMLCGKTVVCCGTYCTQCAKGQIQRAVRWTCLQAGDGGQATSMHLELTGELRKHYMQGLSPRRTAQSSLGLRACLSCEYTLCYGKKSGLFDDKAGDGRR